jgi:biopolymer transport protein ExbD
MAKREIQEINAGSMADIAFLLLIFFLVATTMDVDTGLTRLLPAIPEEEEQNEVQVNKRNVLPVLINRDDQLMVGGELSRVDQLKDKTIEFFTNPNNDPTLPEKEMVEVEFPRGISSMLPADGIYRGMVSKGVISLQNDRSTTYKQYLAVQNELVAAVNELRREFCKLYFDKDYDQLNMANPIDKEINDGIRKIYKMNISEAEQKDYGGNK